MLKFAYQQGVKLALTEAMSTKDARAIGKQIGIEWGNTDYNVEALKQGIEVEHEHGTERGADTNIGGDDNQVAARIALSHLKELPDYYPRLKKMEAEGKKALGKK